MNTPDGLVIVHQMNGGKMDCRISVTKTVVLNVTPEAVPMDSKTLLERYEDDLLSFDDVVEHGLWLEDLGEYSRYALGEGEATVSVWVNWEDQTLVGPDDEDDGPDGDD